MITSTEPAIAPTGKYSIPETCKLLGIHRNTLRLYTQAGKIKCGFRRATGRKFYTGREILRFWKTEL